MIHIQVGDSVKWDWKINHDVSEILTLIISHHGQRIGYFSTSDSPVLHFRFAFREIGVYIYHYNITKNNIISEASRGMIVVSKLRSSLKHIKVIVGGYEAEYDQTYNYSSLSNISEWDSLPHGGSPAGQTDIVDSIGCKNLAGKPANSVLYILYSAQITPLVYSVEPQVGSRLDTVFVIHGSGFCCAIEVKFGNQICNVVNSTESMIHCTLNVNDSNNLPQALVPLPLSLRITEDNRGNAFIVNKNLTMVTLLPVVYEVSPHLGSTEGGNDGVIYGDTFMLATELEHLSLGFPCNITMVTFNEIRFTTLPTSISQDFNVIIHIHGEPFTTVCRSNTGCNFSFSDNHTIEVTSVDAITLYEPNFTLMLQLSLRDPAGLTMLGSSVVKVGDYNCHIDNLIESNITCTVREPIPASDYTLSLRVCNLMENRCFGYAKFADGLDVITVEGKVLSVSPTIGSVLGNTELTITGQSFHPDVRNTHVLINTATCHVKSVTHTAILCITGAHQEGNFLIQVSSNAAKFTGNVTYEYSISSTPTVTSIAPERGQSGDIVTITGSLFGENPDNDSVAVTIGEINCTLKPYLSNNTALTCSIMENFAGFYRVSVIVRSLGLAHSSDVMFQYDLVINGLSPIQGSFAGENVITLHGVGFYPSATTITICELECSFTNTIPSLTEIELRVPRVNFSPDTTDLVCDVVVIDNRGNTSRLIEAGYTYLVDLTPQVNSINRTRGGTQGGTALLIEGIGFNDMANVTIAGSDCIVVSQSDLTIECITEASSRSIRALVKVYIRGKGFAVSNIEFWYVDLWSSRFTWGGGPLPQEGDFVVVRRGQNLVLDTITPILSFILINGGNLTFDREAGDNQVELHTQGMLIVSGGRLEIGTEDDPFLSRTQVVIYGHTLSTELPEYGAKVLGLREGVIDMHGRPLNVTWTKLSATANIGDTEIHLKDWVPWEVGGNIVVASTSFSQRENEYLKVAYIRSDIGGSVIGLGEPLKYEHISVQQVISGRVIDTCAEVGYLTRNVVFRGNLNHEWVENITACEEEFRPGQFEVQTCFRGRFGNEVANDQFGAHIFIHARVKNKGLVTGRFSYIEFTHVGQAFRLGRYPIHFHLNGNVFGSYVRGCAIHHTFNRAVTIHGVDYLLVEKNVVYNVLGHAYFLEDGNEQYNIIQDNLGVFVRASSSLLNVDITPATFWVVNANNIVRRNAAAGGTHFGFWYRLPKNPTGPSFTTSLCPRKQRVLEFADNTAHSFGWYGLWVFRQYTPSPTGDCGDKNHAPSYFDQFLSWKNTRGVEFAESGAVQLRDSIVMDNKLAGIELIELESDWGKDNGTLIANTLIIGYSGISTSTMCTQSGIKTPKSYYLTVSNVTFVNFDRDGCYPIQACSNCKFRQGGFETRFEKISYINAGSQITIWKWEHEHIHRDLDGTLTMTQRPSLLIPTNDLLNPAECKSHSQSSDMNGTMGSICNGTLEFCRVAISDPTPSSIAFSNASFSNEHGTTKLPFFQKRLIGGPGYMAQLQLNQSYLLTWLSDQNFTNISYNLIISGLITDNYLIITQNFHKSLDYTNINGITTAENSSIFTTPHSASTGDYLLSNNNTTLSYIVKGSTMQSNQRLTFSTYRCFYEDCIPPPLPTLAPPVPLGRPENGTLLWSDVNIWPDQQLPNAGDDVTINGSVYIIVDTVLPRFGRIMITDGATIEFIDGMDHVIEADLIIIRGGRLVAGYPDVPFNSRVRIILHGNIATPEYRLDSSPTIGAKAIGVFGELILNANPHKITWTFLSETAVNGSNWITLVDNVDWAVGDSILITSTSYDAYQSEVFNIVSIFSQNHSLILNGTLQYTHRGGENHHGHGSIGAEVGLLSRRIVVENGEPSIAESESFGCRVLVSESAPFYGLALLQEVEFSGCGQLGYINDYDPRFALAFMRGQENSYIKGCSFHNGFNTAIGVFDTNGILIEQNVIHSTVGPSMIITGSKHSITHNLASLSQFIGTYRDRDEPFNSLWTANFEVTDATDFNFTYNHAAGGARAGFHTNGEDCNGQSSSIIRNNVAHSSLHCVHLGYNDGTKSECSLFSNYTLYSCYHYAFFSYSKSGIHIVNTIFANNKAAVYVSVIGPTSLSHLVGNKSVIIEESTIISVTRCEDDSFVPQIATHPRSHTGILSPTKGHVGIVIPSFLSNKGHFPSAPWNSIIAYPTINGSTLISHVTFINFTQACGGKNDATIITNPRSEDANHPLHLESITFINVHDDSRLYVNTPNTNRINPADCVDMDCDGFKQVLLKDMDGSFVEGDSPHTIVSRAEIGWNKNDIRGIGDFRIPRSMLTYPNGSRIDISNIYPHKGIIRRDSKCTFNSQWNMYRCTQLDHLMLVMESLDPDTEVRRLSPVGLGASGYINLINGPMDNGWCGEYTCGERISTFYGIVASGFNYTIGLTSTNPQKFAFHLLNSDDQQAIVVGMIYTNPQRLDVYIYQDGENVYVAPKNAYYVGSDLLYRSLDPTGPDDQFHPTLSDPHGANFYDRTTKQLYITIRGSKTHKVLISPVIMLSMTVTISPEDFFNEDKLTTNLAALLDIPKSKIRVVNVVRETNRRKRSSSSNENISFDVEIGDSPVNSTENVSRDNGIDLPYERLDELSDSLAEVVQTRQLIYNIISATVVRPLPPVLDPAEGLGAVLNESQLEVSLSFPSYLFIQHILSTGVVEGLSLPVHSVLVVSMFGENGELSTTLGIINSWVLTAKIVYGPDGAFLHQPSANFTQGEASFNNLVFSHPGYYTLMFSVTYPPTANFSITSTVNISVLARTLGLKIVQQPLNGDTIFRLQPYPSVELVDLSDGGSPVRNHTWRNTTWFVEACIEEQYCSIVELVNGVATFKDVHINFTGDYRIEFEAYEFPDNGGVYSHPIKVQSESFNIRELAFTRYFYTYKDVDFQVTIGDDVDIFNEVFKEHFLMKYTNLKVFNVETEIVEGSVIVSVYITANRIEDLLAAIDAINRNRDPKLFFTFNGVLFIPSSVVQDPNLIVARQVNEDNNHVGVVLAIVLPILVFIAISTTVVTVIILYKTYRSLKFNLIHVSIQ